MKRLILILLLPVLACEDYATVDHTHDHRHPLIGHDHQHEHGLPDHDRPYLFPEGLPFAYIVSVDPPLTTHGVRRGGVLTRQHYNWQEVVIDFSKPPMNLTLTDIYYPGKHTTPVDHWDWFMGYRDGAYVNRASVYTYCDDVEHEGAIAFRLDWDTGLARLYYRCPDEEE